jgi:hypothetical protein
MRALWPKDLSRNCKAGHDVFNIRTPMLTCSRPEHLQSVACKEIQHNTIATSCVEMKVHAMPCTWLGVRFETFRAAEYPTCIVCQHSRTIASAKNEVVFTRYYLSQEEQVLVEMCSSHELENMINRGY